MKKAIIFALAVCGISWAVFGIFYAIVGNGLSENPALLQSISVLYMFLPLITALLLQKIRKVSPLSTGLLNFKFSWAWIVAIVIPYVILLLSILVSTLVPGAKLEPNVENIIASSGLEGAAADAVREQFTSISPALMIVGTLFSGLLAGCTINAVLAFGEEYGWRNYMVDALRGKSFWKAGLFIGFVWGIWHAPLILMGHNYPLHPVAGVGMMCIFCILMGTIELYFVLKTGSVIPAALIHGVVNAIAGTTLFLIKGGNDLTVGMTGVSGFIAIALVILSIWLYDRGHDRIMASDL